MISGKKKKKFEIGKKKSFFLSITINKVIKIESYKKRTDKVKKKKKFNYSTFLVMKEDASHKLLLYKRIKM